MNGRWLAVAVLAATACTSPAVAQSAVPAVERAAAARDELIVSAERSTLVLDPTSGATLRTLPAGVLSPAKDLLVSVSPEAARCGDPNDLQLCTVAAAYDLQGTLLEEWFLAGRYVLPATYGPAPSGFSPNGKWLVLVKRDTALSSFAILDLASLGRRSSLSGPGLAKQSGKGRWEQVVLSARLSFDAIHDDGGALYLIEHPIAGSTAYNVRLYEVRAKRLVPEPIFDKAQLATFDPAAGLMDGAFHASVAPVGGQWSYGLYVRRDGKPFVHALNVAGRYATCIVDLPGTRSGTSMLALALAPDAKRLYVTDTGTGAVSEIDAETQKVRRSVTFTARGGDTDGARAWAVVSPDGARLYATAQRGIAVLGTGDLALRSWAAPDLAALALALSGDGSRLYALANGVVHVLEAPSGRPIAEYPVPATARAITAVAAR